MTELITALLSNSGLIAIGLFVLAVICFAVFAIKFRNPYIVLVGAILAIAGGIVLLYASGVIAISGNVITIDWAAWNTAPAATPAA